MFGDFLHTHLAGEWLYKYIKIPNLILRPWYHMYIGRGLVLQHFRWNSECNILEELEPISQNMNYDFNFQQYTHLKKEYLVLPVSVFGINYTVGTGDLVLQFCREIFLY